MKDLLDAIRIALNDVTLFAEHLSRVRLRAYQQQAARAIVTSVLEQAGRSFVVIFPRQSGKNELQAQIEAYLLTLLCNRHAEIVKISPTWKPQSQNAMRRLERVLKRNSITCDRWEKEMGYIYRVGQARVYFFSGEPSANIVGATASTLLEVDEAQDILPDKFDKDVAPMAASTNATRVFWGTAWTSSTLLAREKRAALAAQAADGVQRVFELTADQVRGEVPAYGRFVDGEIARKGRNHPMVRTQFFSEEIDSQAGLFTAERLALMRGAHAPQSEPAPGRLYIFCVDVGGEETAAAQAAVDADVTTGPLGPHASVAGVRIGYAEQVVINAGAGLNAELRPASASAAGAAHDSTVLTIFEVDLSTLADPGLQAPTYKVVQRRAWTGAGQPQLYAQLHALAGLWQPQRIVIDATGLGEGLAAFLERSHPGQVLRFKFSQASKSALGWGFISIVESGRYKEYTVEESRVEESKSGNEEDRGSKSPESERRAAGDRGLVNPAGEKCGHSSTRDPRPSDSRLLQDLFFAQARACTLEILPGPGRMLRYGVPASARCPQSGRPLHDDLVLSAMLIAALPDGGWGTGESAVIRPSEDEFLW